MARCVFFHGPESDFPQHASNKERWKLVFSLIPYCICLPPVYPVWELLGGAELCLTCDQKISSWQTCIPSTTPRILLWICKILCISEKTELLASVWLFTSMREWKGEEDIDNQPLKCALMYLCWAHPQLAF